MDFFSVFQVSPYETFIKLAVAALLSLIIGLERELKRKPVGLKTSIVISTFSCLLTIISIESAYIAESSEHNVNITMDPLRLAAQIVSGIGFLGAGVILKRGNDSISGLTTAAMIWGAGGIGIAVAAGFYIEAAFTVLVVIGGIEIVPPALAKFGPKRLRMQDVSLKATVADRKFIQSVTDHIRAQEMVIEALSIADTHANTDQAMHVITIRLSYFPEKETIELYRDISSIEGVKRVEVEVIH